MRCNRSWGTAIRLLRLGMHTSPWMSYEKRRKEFCGCPSLESSIHQFYLAFNQASLSYRTDGVLRGFGSPSVKLPQRYLFRRGFVCGPEGFLFCLFVTPACFCRFTTVTR